MIRTSNSDSSTLPISSVAAIVGKRPSISGGTDSPIPQRIARGLASSPNFLISCHLAARSASLWARISGLSVTPLSLSIANEVYSAPPAAPGASVCVNHVHHQTIGPCRRGRSPKGSTAGGATPPPSTPPRSRPAPLGRGRSYRRAHRLRHDRRGPGRTRCRWPRPAAGTGLA